MVETDNNERAFGRIESPFDSRDFKLENYIDELPCMAMEEEITSKRWTFPQEALDQLNTSRCVGYAGAGWGICLPIYTPFTEKDADRLYYECKELEQQPKMENGAYIRSIAKVLQKEGHLENYAFTRNLEYIRWWLLNKGSVIVGTKWYEGMMTPDENNIIHPTGVDMGGHAYLLTEWREDGYIGIQNSWGSDWGDNGKAYISAYDFDKLLRRRGEAVAAVEIVKKECPKKKNIFQRIWECIVNYFKGN